MPKSFNINNHEVVEFTNKLEKLHKSALPVAVRQTLNDTAFEAKKDVNKTFAAQFTERKRNFIKSHTTVNKSPNTFNINEMQSEMGVIRGRSDAGDELRFQELGGTIQGRSAVGAADVRIGKSSDKLVSKRFYLDKLKGKGVILKNRKQRIYATKKAIIQNVKGEVKPRLLYLFASSRKYSAAPFLEPAGILASSKMPNIFVRNAKKRIEKTLR